MTTDKAIRDVSDMTLADWQSVPDGQTFVAPTVEAPDYIWTYAEEAFLTSGTAGTVDITFARQEPRRISRTMALRHVDAGGVGLEIKSIDSHPTTVLVAQVKYPAGSAVDLAMTILRTLYGTVSPELDSKINSELSTINTPK